MREGSYARSAAPTMPRTGPGPRYGGRAAPRHRRPVVRTGCGARLMRRLRLRHVWLGPGRVHIGLHEIVLRRDSARELLQEPQDSAALIRSAQLDTEIALFVRTRPFPPGSLRC